MFPSDTGMWCPTLEPLPRSSPRPLTCSKESGRTGSRQQDQLSGPGHTGRVGHRMPWICLPAANWPNTQNTHLLSSVALETCRCLLPNPQRLPPFQARAPAPRAPGVLCVWIGGSKAKQGAGEGGRQSTWPRSLPLGAQGSPVSPPRTHADHTLGQFDRNLWPHCTGVHGGPEK